MVSLVGYWDRDTYWGDRNPDLPVGQGGYQQFCVTEPTTVPERRAAIRDLEQAVATFASQLPPDTKGRTEQEKCGALSRLSSAQLGYNPFAIRWDEATDKCQVVTRAESALGACLRRTDAGGWPQTVATECPTAVPCSTTDWAAINK